LLVEGSLEIPKTFVDVGVHELRGCKEPIHLFSMRQEPRSAQRSDDWLVCSRPADEVG
jgi:hypothetical protein